MLVTILLKEIYALYGRHPKVKIPLYTAPNIPVILGVKVSCLCSPSFLKIIILAISSKNGKTAVAIKKKIIPLESNPYILPKTKK